MAVNRQVLISANLKDSRTRSAAVIADFIARTAIRAERRMLIEGRGGGCCNKNSGVLNEVVRADRFGGDCLSAGEAPHLPTPVLPPAPRDAHFGEPVQG